jgi:hypothetical protein
MKRIVLLFFTLACLCSAAAFAAAPAPPSTEKAKIEALIAAVEAMPDAKFIRNGSAHDADAAADHLRLKWRHGGKRIATARDFIRYCATESSLTGRNYRIRFADGREVDSAEFFLAELARIEEAAVTPKPSG